MPATFLMALGMESRWLTRTILLYFTDVSVKIDTTDQAEIVNVPQRLVTITAAPSQPASHSCETWLSHSEDDHSSHSHALGTGQFQPCGKVSNLMSPAMVMEVLQYV